ncbi:MAG: regulatory protein RecX [Burkholderiales bacterium]|nr:regulatory protein RecX [Burkholderiales bacterium]
MRQRRAPRDEGAGTEGAVKPAVSPKALAVRWLARREYSRAELAERLRRRGATADDVERALDELAAAGYLSDARYAQAVVAQRAGRYGRRAIAHALKERGIAAADADVALAPLAGTDELADARALWQRRFGTAPADDRERARQVRFLQSRGYGLSVALSVVCGAARADEDPDT